MDVVPVDETPIELQTKLGETRSFKLHVIPKLNIGNRPCTYNTTYGCLYQYCLISIKLATTIKKILFYLQKHDHIKEKSSNEMIFLRFKLRKSFLFLLQIIK